MAEISIDLGVRLGAQSALVWSIYPLAKCEEMSWRSPSCTDTKLAARPSQLPAKNIVHSDQGLTGFVSEEETLVCGH